uniref:Uncharacterized protein n=1 Tax=Chromera velia CCMP2878 TaxID=1169474 RepID=A0A0G4I704_9ALVE|eukprot:Cvel_11536.t1-p1 / transcript=Cvel_11536.t1 / gene=Cvel_11536 / organism=Chromera_velia_CCMP2878 / gene_product=hypothetical protein / transcript_product=hypothetical protein / location=Cvel_scaffold728:34288-38870(-) / protein_length=1274 / sequence_SO=supercontig / SO=protein_coding / is_pseudo=false
MTSSPQHRDQNHSSQGWLPRWLSLASAHRSEHIAFREDLPVRTARTGAKDRSSLPPKRIFRSRWIKEREEDATGSLFSDTVGLSSGGRKQQRRQVPIRSCVLTLAEPNSIQWLPEKETTSCLPLSCRANPPSSSSSSHESPPAPCKVFEFRTFWECPALEDLTHLGGKGGGQGVRRNCLSLLVSFSANAAGAHSPSAETSFRGGGGGAAHLLGASWPPLMSLSGLPTRSSLSLQATILFSHLQAKSEEQERRRKRILREAEWGVGDGPWCHRCSRRVLIKGEGETEEEETTETERESENTHQRQEREGEKSSSSSLVALPVSTSSSSSSSSSVNPPEMRESDGSGRGIERGRERERYEGKRENASSLVERVTREKGSRGRRQNASFCGNVDGREFVLGEKRVRFARAKNNLAERGDVLGHGERSEYLSEKSVSSSSSASSLSELSRSREISGRGQQSDREKMSGRGDVLLENEDRNSRELGRETWGKRNRRGEVEVRNRFLFWDALRQIRRDREKIGLGGRDNTWRHLPSGPNSYHTHANPPASSPVCTCPASLSPASVQRQRRVMRRAFWILHVSSVDVEMLLLRFHEFASLWALSLTLCLSTPLTSLHIKLKALENENQTATDTNPHLSQHKAHSTNRHRQAPEEGQGTSPGSSHSPFPRAFGGQRPRRRRQRQGGTPGPRKNFPLRFIHGISPSPSPGPHISSSSSPSPIGRRLLSPKKEIQGQNNGRKTGHSPSPVKHNDPECPPDSLEPAQHLSFSFGPKRDVVSASATPHECLTAFVVSSPSEVRLTLGPFWPCESLREALAVSARVRTLRKVLLMKDRGERARERARRKEAEREEGEECPSDTSGVGAIGRSRRHQRVEFGRKREQKEEVVDLREINLRPQRKNRGEGGAAEPSEEQRETLETSNNAMASILRVLDLVLRLNVYNDSLSQTLNRCALVEEHQERKAQAERAKRTKEDRDRNRTHRRQPSDLPHLRPTSSLFTRGGPHSSSNRDAERHEGKAAQTEIVVAQRERERDCLLSPALSRGSGPPSLPASFSVSARCKEEGEIEEEGENQSQVVVHCPSGSHSNVLRGIRGGSCRSPPFTPAGRSPPLLAHVTERSEAVSNESRSLALMNRNGNIRETRGDLAGGRSPGLASDSVGMNSADSSMGSSSGGMGTIGCFGQQIPPASVTEESPVSGVSLIGGRDQMRDAGMSLGDATGVSGVDGMTTRVMGGVGKRERTRRKGQPKVGNQNQKGKRNSSDDDDDDSDRVGRHSPLPVFGFRQLN